MKPAISLDLPRLVCRPALPQDTEAIMDLTSMIWNGHDYIRYVWRDWLADPQGLLAVAEFGAKIVGMGKLTKLDDENWWMEGLRVHPAFEGRGFASHIQGYLLQQWQQMGKGAVRLATSSQRVPVHRICQRTGFERVAEITAFSADTYEAGQLPQSGDGGFARVEEGELEAAWAFAAQNPLHQLWAGLIDLGWQWMPLRKGTLRQQIQAGQAFWWRGKTGLLVCGEDEDEDEPGKITAMMRWVGCQPEALEALCREYRCLSREQGYPKASWMAPLQPEITDALEKAGFQREWEQSLYIFEKWYNPAR
jgi:GNAT superfamily N-acetyltransferase